ncbi:MAG TPA: hypothetical protein VGR35_09455 [Tepidisphaeraceae bacterium]|nr:hypothetical protein [Tepidisphaeraceae bacterium]
MSDTTNEQPDLTKSFSRWNAPYWAMKHGICAALGGDARWTVLCALYTYLPNVYPGRSGIETLTGLSSSSVKRARKGLKAVGLVDFSEGNSGGGRDTSHVYTMTDIRDPAVAASIVARIKGLTGVTVNPVGTGVIMNPVQNEPGTGVIMNPHGGHNEPGTGVIMNPEVLNRSSQSRTQEKDVTAPPLAGSAGLLTGVAPAGGETHGGGSSSALGLRPQSEPEVDDHAKPVEPVVKRDRKSKTRASSDPARAQLSDEDKSLITASAESMERYLLAGIEAVRGVDPAELKPSGMNWRRFNGSVDDPKAEQWDVPAFAGYYWWRVSRYREKRTIPITLPNFKRLVGDIRNLLGYMTKKDLHQYIGVVITHFELVQFMCKGAGETMALNETSLSHNLIKTTAFNIAQMSEGQRLTKYAAMRKAYGLAEAA